MAQLLRALAGPRFHSQNAHGSSQLSLIPILGHWNPLLTFVDTRHMHAGKPLIPVKLKL